MFRTRSARIAIALALAAFAAILAAAPIALESVSIAGSKATKDAVMAIAALKIGAPIDQAAIEDACKRLQATGLFASVEYTFRPGLKQGLAVTMNLGAVTTTQPAGAARDRLYDL